MEKIFYLICKSLLAVKVARAFPRNNTTMLEAEADNFAKIQKLIQDENLNPIAQRLLNKLFEIRYQNLSSEYLDKALLAMDDIRVLVDNEVLRELMLFTVSVCTKYTPYKTASLALPYLFILGDKKLRMDVYSIEASYDSSQSDDNNIFRRVVQCTVPYSNTSQRSVVETICRSLRLPLSLSNSSGLGLTFSSWVYMIDNPDLMRTFEKEPNLDPWLLSYVTENGNNMKASIEAVDETVDEDTEDTVDDDTTDDGEEPNQDTTGDDDTSNEDDPSPEDNNTDEPEPKVSKIFDTGLTLATDESLDDILYKLTISRKITQICNSETDEVSPETVKLLKKWQHLFLFLVQAKDTETLLKELKIKGV